MTTTLTEHQTELLGLLTRYEELTDDKTDYYLRYINGHTVDKPLLTPWTAPDSEGYYIVKETETGIGVLTTRLNANTIQSLINRNILTKHTHPFSYKSNL